MTKKSDKSARKFFDKAGQGIKKKTDQAGKTVGGGFTSFTKGADNLLMAPFKSFDNLADGLTGGNSIILYIAPGIGGLVLISGMASSRR